MAIGLLIMVPTLAAFGGYGIKKTIKASDRKNEARNRLKNAKWIYEHAQQELSRHKDVSAEKLNQLGLLKMCCWSENLTLFIEHYSRISDLQPSELPSKQLPSVAFNHQAFEKLKSLAKLSSEVSERKKEASIGVFAGIGAYGCSKVLNGATPGNALAASRVFVSHNATLSWLNGSAKASGTLGFESKNLILGGAVSFSQKFSATSQLNKAIESEERANKASASMKASCAVLKSIDQVTDGYSQLITKLKEGFDKRLRALNLILGSEERCFAQFSEINKGRIADVITFAKIFTNIIETPLLGAEGNLKNNHIQVIRQGMKLLK